MAVSSTMLPLGTRAPDFRLPDTRTGKRVSLEDFGAAPAFLAVFTCNHCPYAMHVKSAMAALIAEYQPRGLGAVAISSNDVGTHPQDGPAEMAKVAAAAGFTFPYLYDESQEVAAVYNAACTPDFFLFDGDRRLVYRGQMDGSRPGNDVPLTGVDLRAALDAVLAGRPVSGAQKPSIGCGIKWKPGMQPEGRAG
jgi:peroxiredoxin